jgi:hypothetical protein
LHPALCVDLDDAIVKKKKGVLLCLVEKLSSGWFLLHDPLFFALLSNPGLATLVLTEVFVHSTLILVVAIRLYSTILLPSN